VVRPTRVRRLRRRRALKAAIVAAGVVLSVTIVTLIWRFVLAPDAGLLGDLWTALGWTPLPFLSDTHLALPALAVTTIWWSMGFPMLLFLAGLQGVPDELHEAAAMDGAGPLKYSVTLGQRWPFHATGGGKLYLAQFDDERLREVLTEKPLEQITPRTVVDVDALVTEVAEVRRRGWASQREEIHEGIAGFAAPVVDAAGNLLGALVVMGPTARVDEHADSIVAAMLAEAQALSVEVGALAPEAEATVLA